MAEVRESNKLVVKVDVDVSDALKGLKALKREANKTLKALEKVREAQERDIINFIANVTIQDAWIMSNSRKESAKKLKNVKKKLRSVVKHSEKDSKLRGNVYLNINVCLNDRRFIIAPIMCSNKSIC
jgi:SpoVK/Ycf46/Vps4 family AAA+-type ATPase